MKTQPLRHITAVWIYLACTLASGVMARAAHTGCLEFGEPLSRWLVLKPIPIVGEKKAPVNDTAQLQAFARDWLATAGGEAQAEPHCGTKVKICGRTFKWEAQEAVNGSVDLVPPGRSRDHTVAYASAEFEVPASAPAVLGIGSDDFVKGWLNGNLVHENRISRGVKMDDDLVPVELRAGKNRILLKVQNGIGPSGFACRVLSGEQAESLRLARGRMQNPPTDSLKDEQIQAILRDYIDTDRLGVGMAVGIVDEHGSRVVSQGKLANGSSREVDGDTLFEIGSITKVFTALLLQDMIERGQMSLDDPVQKYLPDSVKMPAYRGKQVKLLHLATHTSGLPRDVGNAKPRSWRDPGARYTLQQLYEFLSGCTLRHAPGTKEEYSNLGLELLGHVIELKAGKGYESLLQERICRPLGMDSTHVQLTPELKARLATGHVIPGSAVCSSDFSVLPAAGAIKCTAHDLLTFVSAYSGLTPSPLREVMDKAEEQHALESGGKRRLVWFGSGSVFEHGGTTFGYRTQLAFDESRRRGIVMLSNCGLNWLVDNSWQALLEGRPLQRRRAAVPACNMYDRYVGLYETERHAQCTVRRQGDRLMVRWLGTSDGRKASPSFEIFPQSDSIFYNEPWTKQLIQISFLSQGEKMVLAGPEFCLETRKISAKVPETPEPVCGDAKLYASYAGRYRMALLFGFLRFGPTLNIVHETDDVGEHLVGYVSGPGARAMLNRLGGGSAGGELFPESKTTFFTPYSSVPLRGTFIQNNKGKTTSMVIELGGRKIKGVRVGR